MHSIRTPSSSITNGTSKNKDQSRKGPLQDSSGKREIPRVEIFLDCHLSKAIQQIRISSNSKPAIVKPINLIANQKKTELPNDSCILEQKEQTRVNAQYQQVDRKWRQQIELMPNEIVLDYIKEVYQKYGIINPFEGYLDDKILNDKIGHKQVNNNNSLSHRKQQINKGQTIGRRVRKNWHSFSQQKQSRFGEQPNNSRNEHIYQDVYDDNFTTLKKFDVGGDNDKQFMNRNKKDTAKTEKKKLSQNQQRILQLKNKFKLIESGGDNNANQQTSVINININNQQQQQQQQKQQQYPPPTTTHQKKQSYGSITYIDNLKNLMQSQLIDFGSSSRANGNSSERSKLLTMKFINSMGDVMGMMKEGKMVGPQEGEDNTREDDHTQSAIRPKKKLFVKTIRGTSTKNNSIQDTPAGTESAKKSDKNIFDQSSLIVIDTNSKQQTAFGNNKLFMSINQPQYYSSNPQTLPYRTSLTSSVTTSSMYIPQHHRYCLGCQQPILDSNILYHEENCQAWRKIAQLSVQQLIQIVDNKLAKIRQKLSQNQLFNLKIDDINEIKALGKRVLNDNMQEQQQRQKPTSNKELSHKISKDNVSKIDKLLQKKVLRGCEMIKKLQWFIKLRTTIQSQLDSQANKHHQNNIRRSQQKKISAFSLLQ